MLLLKSQPNMDCPTANEMPTHLALSLATKVQPLSFPVLLLRKCQLAARTNGDTARSNKIFYIWRVSETQTKQRHPPRTISESEHQEALLNHSEALLKHTDLVYITKIRLMQLHVTNQLQRPFRCSYRTADCQHSLPASLYEN